MKTNSSENYLDQLLNSVNGEHTDGKDAEDMLALGASRLGTSRIVKIVKNEEAHGY